MIFRTVVIGEGGCDNCGSIGIGEGEGGFVGIREILPASTELLCLFQSQEIVLT